MGMSGGNHTRVHNWVADKNSDIKITASRFDEENDDLSSSLSVMIARDGQSTITANIPFGGFRPVQVGDATAQTHLAKYSDISTGKGNYVTVSETTAENSISAVGAIAITAYTTGQANWMFPGFNNTGGATLNINGVNTDAILAGGAALTSGMLLSGVAAMVISDAADFHLMNPQRSPANFVNEAGIQNDAVTINKIPDNTITLAKLNHETVQGEIIYTDAAGTPTYLAAGTANEFLMTGGAGANPSWSSGFTATIYDAGTQSSGTYTPDETNGNMQKAINGGAHTLAPPSNDCTLVIQYTNDGSAGTITTSGFTKVDGDTISTTNGDDFFFYITNSDTFSLLTVKALQ